MIINSGPDWIHEETAEHYIEENNTQQKSRLQKEIQFKNRSKRAVEKIKTNLIYSNSS
ncbi:hypothetical protein MOB01_18040 [Bacillus spizizenii]|nr:hypothetical protein [Bacillus spizizenii]